MSDVVSVKEVSAAGEFLPGRLSGLLEAYLCLFSLRVLFALHSRRGELPTDQTLNSFFSMSRERVDVAGVQQTCCCSFLGALHSNGRKKTRRAEEGGDVIVTVIAAAAA